MVSKARLDLPEPDRPVITTSASRGSSREMSFRLCSRAPETTILLPGAIKPPFYDGEQMFVSEPHEAKLARCQRSLIPGARTELFGGAGRRRGAPCSAFDRRVYLVDQLQPIGKLEVL